MTQGFMEGPDALTGPALDAVLAELCEAKRTAQLATPYLAFDTRFLEREGGELRMWATMNRSVAEHTLSQNPLRVRFPWALTMWAGATRVLGFEQDERRRSLRIAVPEWLGPDEQRAHYRVDRCGKSVGTLGNEHLTVVRVTVENLGVGGAGLFASGDLDPAQFGAGRLVTLNLVLEGGAKLQAPVRIVHVDGFRLGVAFQPDLEGEALDRLGDWVRPRWAEAKRGWANRAETRIQAEVAQVLREPEGLLLVTSSGEVEAQIRPLLSDLPELRTSPANMAGLRKALQPPPRLALVHVPQGGLEERRKQRALLEALAGIPLVLLSGPQGTALAQELGGEFRALTLAWNPSLGPFLRRMVEGLLRKQAGANG